MIYKWSDMLPREQDALVARSIFGIEKFFYTFEDKYAHTQFGTLHAFETPVLLHYISNIASSWEVIKKICGKYYVEIFYKDPIWECYFREYHGSTFYEGLSVEAPQAICIAALRSVGVHIE